MPLHKSKSCEDVKILYNNFGGLSTTYNVIDATNLIKNSRCFRKTDCQQNAYNLPLPHPSTSPKHKQSYKSGRFKRKIVNSQDQINQFLAIENQSIQKAHISLCGVIPSKVQKQINCTAQQLSVVKTNTLISAKQRSTMVRNVMNNCKQNYTKKMIEGQKVQKSSEQSIQTDCLIGIETQKSIKNCTIDSLRQKTIKRSALIKKLQKQDLKKLAIVQRRKQTWKAFQQAERKQIKMGEAQEKTAESTVIFVSGGSKPKNNKLSRKTVGYNETQIKKQKINNILCNKLMINQFNMIKNRFKMVYS